MYNLAIIKNEIIVKRDRQIIESFENAVFVIYNIYARNHNFSVLQKCHSLAIEWPTAPQFKDHTSSRLRYRPSWKSRGRHKNDTFRQIYPSCKVARSLHVLLIPDGERMSTPPGFKDPAFISLKLSAVSFWNKDLMSLQDGGEGGDAARGQ